MKRYVEWIIRYRLLVIALSLLVTGASVFQIKNLRVIVDPNTMLPQDHPYVEGSNEVERLFGSKYEVIIGITPKTGDAFQPHVLEKVQRMTAVLHDTPGAVKENILSLSARRAKNIVGTSEGMEVRPLMESVPQTPQQVEALRKAVRANPVYSNAIVSRDERTTAIIVEFKDPRNGFREIMKKVSIIVERERDPSVEISIGGLPVFLAQLEDYSQRMTFLVPIAVLIVGLIHYEAFRTLQGLILPLVTALLAIVWGLGVMGFLGVPMDVFNATTPILILAVAAGHAVQILKRYYEEYHRLRASTSLSPSGANQAAVIESVTKIGPVMLMAGAVAALGFFSLMVFGITTIRTFGVFTGIGILSALILEMTFIPAVRSLLPAPTQREERREQEQRTWDRHILWIASRVTAPSRKPVYLVALLLILLCAVGTTWVTVDNSLKNYFFADLPIQRDDQTLNSRLGGTNTLYLMIKGKEEDTMKDPKVLRAMEATQRFLEQQPEIGKTLSLADFLKRMNGAMHGDDPTYDRIPESRELVSQFLLLYSMSGEPGDFDSYVDNGYQAANIWVFLKTQSSAYLQDLMVRLHGFLSTQFGDHLQILIGGSVPGSTALNEVMVHGKLLNIFQIAGVIFFVTSVVFRSFLAGFLVLVPLLLAVLANFGLMGLAGIRLNIPTSITSAMAVGIGADYAIYLIYRLREELACGVDEATAVRTTLATAGKASLFVASAVAGGYGVLLLSWGFYIHLWLAILIATAMLVSSLSALIILPSLILTFRPRFIFRTAREQWVRPSPMTTGCLIAIGVGLLSTQAFGADLTATEIMEKNFVATKTLDSISDSTFTLINKSGQERIRKTFGTTKLQSNGIDNMRMVRFLSPSDVKGTVTLLIEHSGKDDDIWVYLPALKKVRRLVSSNKKDSFVGTDFSYGDVIGYKVEEWVHHLIREEVVDGKACYIIESLPKSNAVQSNSGYFKRLSWIRKDNFVSIKGEFWDESGEPLKTFTASDVQLVDPVRGRSQAMRLETANTQTGHRTIILFENFKANQGIKEDFFTTRYMERE